MGKGKINFVLDVVDLRPHQSSVSRRRKETNIPVIVKCLSSRRIYELEVLVKSVRVQTSFSAPKNHSQYYKEKIFEN